MRLRLLYEQTLTYEQFIEQPNWINILYINYLTNQPPLTAPDPTSNTIDNDIDYFTRTKDPSAYLKQLPEPTHDHLTKALILKTKNPEYAYLYARDMIKGRWPEAEEIIRQNPHYACLYARDIIKRRWLEAEETIRQNPYCACLYAQNMIKGRWPEAEETIRQNPYCACHYARDMIKGRWPEAEETIRQNPECAYHYARDVIKGEMARSRGNHTSRP